ncbi:MAG: DUF1232 domain-containing protein [Candidatus Marinimicrobia bacterium]|nr:DUF1232 domain-containing protein [Candidatus Neomarinimicrobiota bacterium]
MVKMKDNYQKLIGKFAKDKEVHEEDKKSFFDKVLDAIGLEQAKILFHIATHPKCAKNVFSAVDIAIIIGAVAYVIMPLDAIPDPLPPGLIDDIVVITGVLHRYGNLLQQYKRQCM